MRIYDEVDMVFGAATNYTGGGLHPDWYYKGFQYTLRFGVDYGAGDTGNHMWANGDPLCTCDSDACPLRDGCIGVCSWNYFWNADGNKCERCPYYCHDGCSTNGSC